MKTVVITGGTRGLGFELARNFRKNDFNVVICGTRENTTAEAVRKLEAESGTGHVLGIRCDVSNPEEVDALASDAVDAFGQIDIWINNAGVNQSAKLIWELEPDEVAFLMNVDLRGAINGSTTAAKQMIKQGYGAIYNVEGMGSNDAFQPRLSVYGTAKRAVTYFTDALANEFRTENLPLIAGKLSPGIMITDFLTTSKGGTVTMQLDARTKKVYNILGDRPDVIAEFLTKGILKNTKNGARIAWLTNIKAAFRFMTSAFNKRDFFK